MASIGQELLNAPFPEMVKSLGIGIAEAQFELDKVSMQITKFMAGLDEDGNLDEEKQVKLTQDGASYSLLGLGFTPTFYQFVDTVIELKIDISMRSEVSSGTVSVSGKVGFLSASAVGARYSQKYQYSAEGSSLMRTKLVTVPSPPILEEIIRAEILNSEEEEEA
ncbi:MAG: hypothetical protein MI810_25205 [Flavobacteriales bacterium]|jgi:hypothetical protein|nr:hypothetical protein [Flavobacteriales bacterium]